MCSKGEMAGARIDSAELMDRTYRRQRHVYDFTRKYFLLGRDLLIAGLDARPNNRVLEIGCGTGRNLIVAARRYPGARFYGLDISSEMLTSARMAVASAGLSARLHVARADATGFDPAALFGEAAFERIFISYSLSMIPDWQQAIEAAAARLAPGGALHIVDFGGQSGLPHGFRALLRRWIAQFHVTPRDDLDAVLQEVAGRRGLTLSLRRPYRDYAQYAVLTRDDAVTA
jgi:S-adenosylmethionine-diacylgycerolhomoserine-N-methlytransferase